LGFSAGSQAMKLLMRAVDEKSGQIITYLASKRHASVKELSDLVDASSDMSVLIRIRKVINPKAQRILGKPIITFERSKTDPLTGDKIVFSWWLEEDLMDCFHYDELLDIFDEEGLVRVTAFLPPDEKKVEVKVEDIFLVISGERYRREISLPCPVENSLRTTINNSVLEVRLNKVEPEGKHADRYR